MFKRASTETIFNVREFYINDRKRFYEYYNSKAQFRSYTGVSDYNKLRLLGTGAFGNVVLVVHKKAKKYFAAKLLEKKRVVELGRMDRILSEKRVLQALNHPFCVYLECYFVDNSFLYFVLPFVVGVEMFTLLKKRKVFDEELSRFYAAQVFLGLEYLHYIGLIYRDLKTENLLVDEGGYLKITEFGNSKIVPGRTWTLCGTPEYLAPEMILSKGYGNSIDWWAYGVLIYEMNAGFSPFYHKDHMQMFNQIVSGNYKSPQHFSQDLKDIIKCLLEIDLSKRYGNLLNGTDDIKNHNWFKPIGWLLVLNKKMSAPYKPVVNMAKITSKSSRIEDLCRVSTTNHYAEEFKNF